MARKDPIEVLQAGESASFVHNAVLQRVTAKERAIIDSLIAAYRGNSLTPELMRGKIGEMAALRQLLNDLQRETAQAVEFREKVLSPSR